MFLFLMGFGLCALIPNDYQPMTAAILLIIYMFAQALGIC